ncbi:EpsG family protein [Comamonas thiooxydans]|uniref:EpsG family protein n=1 Tax=Comamonas thiooxydans TaxID=363952 RepID=UPI0009EE49DE|nr:EpsG family protein [Comamonas thiooxydans]
MIYIIGWFIMFVSAFLQSGKNGGKFLAGGGVLYCAFIALFRGDVGTDTSAYISIFEGVLNGEKEPYAEFGFIYLTKFIIFIFSDPAFSVKSISILFFGLLLLFVIRSSRDERFLLLSFILPVFSFSYSMNVIRVGIAAAISLLIFQSIIKNGFSKKLKYFIVAVSFQYTALVMPLFFYISCKSYKNKIPWRYVIGGGFLGGVFIFLYRNYIFEKISLYKDSYSPSVYSGMANLILVIFIVALVSLGRLPRNDKVKIFTCCFCFVFFAWLFSRFSYAGLRVIDMLTFVVPMVVLFYYRKNDILLDKYAKFGFYISGVIFSFNTYFGYINEFGIGDSPFLPYNFSFL